MIKRLLYTLGEPSGIGPDLAILHAVSPYGKNYQLVAVCDPRLLSARAELLNKPIQLVPVNLEDKPTPMAAGQLAYLSTDGLIDSSAGTPNTGNATYVLNTLTTAIDACKEKKCHGMVTGPIQKSMINDAGILFSGHTEFLAEKTNTDTVVMMLATQGLKVALATTHLPLKEVSNTITQETLITTIRILHNDLKNKFAIDNPSILVCGLNPHAGEGGHLGKEEIETIIPALHTLQSEGIHCRGPLPADTLFTPKYLENADAVLAMYHDQGLPVLKYKGFGAAANITLGLPIIRTSVDHGTALDLAGTGNIDTGSLYTAIEYALGMSS